jgi:hypothetical protein
MSVRAIGFVIIGHQNHHQKIFEERYLWSKFQKIKSQIPKFCL